MLQKFRFVGTTSQIGDVRLDRLGQEIALSDEDARNAIEGGAPLVTSELFDRIGFTREELTAFAYTGGQIDAPAEVHAKLARARQLVGVGQEVSE